LSSDWAIRKTPELQDSAFGESIKSPHDVWRDMMSAEPVASDLAIKFTLAQRRWSEQRGLEVFCNVKQSWLEGLAFTRIQNSYVWSVGSSWERFEAREVVFLEDRVSPRGIALRLLEGAPSWWDGLAYP
jgi:hypothetical protein